MRIVPKFQSSGRIITDEQIEQNKRKQQFLNMNGIKTKVDGNWSPQQQEQYQKLTTKDKHYNTTPLGFLSYLYDKTLGNGTTYQEDPAIVKGYSGEIKQDDRSATRRYLDQQMQDNKTSLGYITQTVLPSAAVASSIVYGGPAVVNGSRAAVSNPSSMLPAAKTLVKKELKELLELPLRMLLVKLLLVRHGESRWLNQLAFLQILGNLLILDLFQVLQYIILVKIYILKVLNIYLIIFLIKL